MTPEERSRDNSGYVSGLVDSSYDWYKSAAKKARTFHRLSEVLLLLGSAAIPVLAVMIPGNTVIPASIGGLLVVITGLRSSFHWHDDYLRFSQARESVEAERRLYRTGAPPYGDAATRDQMLARVLSEIEQKEMGVWLQMAGSRNEPTELGVPVVDQPGARLI
ncbi:DUF4231 domain-containing protein [Nocardia sp. NPDC051750]|uniref:DUF4231 domain-containing protein n=1 Tax=Nocardia sp. NPDC051750 TaxID=3364325 RepID=UPI0037B2E9FD